jgi:arylsulfatase A-like enzyme
VTQPNIIFILADDLGYGDLQCYGILFWKLPNINALAKNGVLFSRYYSPSPLCAPARAAILTGRYNHRTGAVDVSSNRAIDRIALSEHTIETISEKRGTLPQCSVNGIMDYMTSSIIQAEGDLITSMDF